MAISPQALIDKFKYALENKWGYIWGQSGAIWTEAKQRAATREMTVKYGSRWIGHRVADCSGLFYWAIKQLGGDMYHGSNTMYRSYCKAKGKLAAGKRSDGQALLPGTAVFTGTADSHGHVGLYIGDGKVIEAKGTEYGVIESRVTEKKWTYWGELKGVNYSAEEADSWIPGDDGKIQNKPTLRKGSKGEDVKDLQQELINQGYSCGPCGVDGDFGSATEKAVKAFQKDHGLTVDGIVGPKTWAALELANTHPPSEPIKYTITIRNLSGEEMEALKDKYPRAEITRE